MRGEIVRNFSRRMEARERYAVFQPITITISCMPSLTDLLHQAGTSCLDAIYALCAVLCVTSNVISAVGQADTIL